MATGERTRDPDFLGQAFRALIDSQEEFSIKVEGAKTLPYTAVLMTSDAGARTLVVKLFRPFPPALPAGAWFEMVFSALGKRYEGRIPLIGRAGYLQYEFHWPASLLSTDRRIWKRYPFRPRESVFVTAQDNEIPCHGFTGALANLSLGGFLFRVDRMVRLEDGMPIRPAGNTFAQGKVFSMVKVHGLAKSETLESRGLTVRVEERESLVHLAVQFQGLDDAARALLTRVLEAREHKPGATGSFTAGEVRGDLAGPEAAGDEPEPVAAAPAGPEPAGSGQLRRLDRRTARILVVAAEGEDQAAILGQLQANGFWRVESEPDLFAAHDRLRQAGGQPFRLLVVDLEPSRREGLEAIGAVRHLEPLLRVFGELPVAYASRQAEPMLELLDLPGRGAVAQADPDPARCTRELDRLLRIH